MPSAQDKWTVGRICWFSCLCVGTVYSYLWDVLMDWSLLERCDKVCPSPLLKRNAALIASSPTRDGVGCTVLTPAECKAQAQN